ncbi:transposase [Paenibacillus sp. P96]|uniref:Transposase n=1 Tax=Paenibacillus zeirhizosphaerae TaxID=2987519 RepID=A0ABT9FXD4_9BACL|nr:transposase [Paenibacillus sp. P96]MDP4099388.1 transposase [Paenibacillus sp. P96]
MKKKTYDLNFKKMVVAEGKEIGNMTAVARQHGLNPKMVLRWAREFNRKDMDQQGKKQQKLVTTIVADDADDAELTLGIFTD